MHDSPLIAIGLPIAVAIIMCGIGMTLGGEDFARVSRRPKALAVGLVGHYVVLPIIGFAVAWWFRQVPEFAVGFVLIAACPSGSMSNAMTFLARGNVALAITLTVASALATFASVPLLVGLASAWFGGAQHQIRIPFGPTVLQLAALVLLPVSLGMLLRRVAPALAARIEPKVSRFALLTLLALVVAIIASQFGALRRALVELGPGVFAMCTAAVAAGFALARALKLSPRDAVTIGIEVGMQNVTLAILIALTIIGSERVALPAAIYGSVMYLPALAAVAYGRRMLPR